MTGIAAIMVVSQLGKITRISVDADGFLAELVYVARHLEHVHVPTLVLGVTTLILMLAGSVLFPRAPIALIGVLGAAAASAMLGLQDHGVRVIGEIPFGFPAPGFPDLPAASLPSMLAPALGVAFVGYTDNVLTGRAFAAHHGDRIDAKREMLALGTANLGAGLLHGFPVSSSGSRTAIVDAVGGRTQLTGLVTLLSTVVAVFDPPAGPRGASGGGARRRRGVRRCTPRRHRGVPSVRGIPAQRVPACARNHDWGAGGRRAVGHPAGDRTVRARLAAAGEPGRTTQSRALSPGWPACTT